MDTYRVIFHINEEDKWPTVLGNVSNLLADLHDKEMDVIVLANGSSVHSYTKVAEKSHTKKLQQLADKGVQFKACNNSLKAQALEAEDLLTAVSIVPVGVTELVIRQQAGYAYIKP